jgi:sugar phosphate permease
MTATPHPRVRWGIDVLLGAGVLVNYFDRINLSVGAPQLQQDFGLTDAELGWLFSGFFWSYALLQIPTGTDARPLRRHMGLSGQRLSLVAHFGRDRPRRRVR